MYDMARGSAMQDKQEQEVVKSLTANWVWPANWVDSSERNTAGRIVEFTRQFDLAYNPDRALLYCSADTRYKLYVNGARVAVGPSRGCCSIWYYDTVDIQPYLHLGENQIQFVVLRYFASSRAAMPFERTAFPGVSIYGRIQAGKQAVDLDTPGEWRAQINDSILFPTGLIDDVFLHINERVSPTGPPESVKPKAYGFKTLNGELSPWRLRPRSIPMPEETIVAVDTIRACHSPLATDDWAKYLSASKPITLPAGSSHTLELQAEVHSTAFLRWTFYAQQSSQIKLKIMYSEGYEHEPRSYPFFRTKSDRLDATEGHLIGPFDEVILDVPVGQRVTYEPFWFRTFRIIRLNVVVGSAAVSMESFLAKQVNYPLNVKASWRDAQDADSCKIWDVSIRTLRNCMFDAYVDCPFYEQLQYSGDSRLTGLFHYLLSGDDRLMRQTITNFAASITPEGMTQSRFPSHVPQIIAGFSLFWVLQVCDHYLFFGDTKYTRSFLPRIDGILEFFDSHVDEDGLIGGLPKDMWQYVDWVTSWGATDEHEDKGVPTSGRTTNRHTYFSLLYAYVLKQAAWLVREVNRPGYALEFETRAESMIEAVRKHCYDGRFFTDSTADVAREDAYSQHCQVFAVLSGAVPESERTRLLQESFARPDFSECSYVMKFYALRAFALAGEEAYASFWTRVWDPWRKMLRNNLSTWEEDDVRQRSDCHAWGSVPIYEYCTELAGVQPVAPGCKKILFKPRLHLSKEIDAEMALGSDNVAKVSWTSGEDGHKHVKLRLARAVEVVSVLPGGARRSHGVTDNLELDFAPHPHL